MKVETYSSRPYPGMSDCLALSCSESFRLFSEGLQALTAYEQSAEKSCLETANQRLELCVNKYPADVLPKFYLGIAKSFLGDMQHLEEAINYFRSVESINIHTLRLSTKYNMAASYIEKYNDTDMQRAEELLDEVITELSEKKSLRNETLWTRFLTLLRIQNKPQVDEFLFQSWALLLYVRIHRDLWEKRQPDNLEGLGSTIEKLGQELDRFWKEFNLADPGHNSGVKGILADYWNAKATFEESLASLYSIEQPEVSREHAAKAIAEFEKAIRMKPNWPAAKANIARMNWKLLGQVDKAEALFTELINGVEQVEYAYYCRGEISFEAKKYKRAAEDFAKASNKIPRAQKKLARTLQLLNQPIKAREVLERFLENFPDDTEARDSLASLQQAPSRTNESTLD